jgi:hypothetical protein
MSLVFADAFYFVARLNRTTNARCRSPVTYVPGFSRPTGFSWK